MVQEERSFLLEQFGALSHEVKQAESSIQEISQLSQLFTEQVLKQGHQIEQLYMDAVRATLNIERGNKELSKALDVRKSGRIFLIAYIFLATAGMLFMDWFYS